GARLERRRCDGDVALLLEDAVHPVDRLLGLGSRFDREDVVVLVLEVASLVRPQSSECGRHRRRLQTDGGDVDEVNCVAHVALPATSPESPSTGPPNYPRPTCCSAAMSRRSASPHVAMTSSRSASTGA